MCSYRFPVPLSRVLLLFFFLGTLFSSTGKSQQADQDTDHQVPSLKVLLITGGCCHDYQNQKKLISAGLSKQIDGIDWTVLEYGSGRDIKADVYEDPTWINGYDLVIHNECFGGVEDPRFVRGIVDGHTKSGVPAMVIHCSMHSYRNSDAADAWRALLGVTSRRHERVKRSLNVQLTDDASKYSVGEVIGKGWDTPNGELYIIEEVWPATTVLATAYSPETKKNEPVVWVNQHLGVRVFGISLGHHNETIESAEWQSIVTDGMRWLLTGKSKK